jgi:UDP-2,4-diacetamido-2,4,6-trideoxy-beta-L-altropyranose hydrolase
MRCLVLAHQARLRGVSIEFICTDLPGHLGAMANQQGFTLRMIGADPGNQRLADFDWERDASLTSSLAGGSPWDWLDVDHYGIDWRWEAAMRPATRQILVIDDLADRVHDCDVLVDQNYYLKLSSRYDKLVPFGCRKLLGPRFLLLRPEFKNTKLSLPRQIGDVKRILISFGGTDETNVTCMALDAITLLGRPDIALDVVIGATSPHRAAVEARLSALPQSLLHVQTSRMAELIMGADIAIGACGSSTWERCYLGLPTLVLVLADNQRQGAAELNATGAILNLGEAHDMTPNSLALAIFPFFQSIKESSIVLGLHLHLTLIILILKIL